jgi:Tol biopolymer transport system component
VTRTSLPLLAALALLASAAAPAHTPASDATRSGFPGRNGLLSYVESLSYNPLTPPTLIAVVPATGKKNGKRLIGSLTAYDGNPAWSPSGKRIAFESTEGGSDVDIWVASAHGTREHELTFASSADQNPAWSPDGTKIVFQSDRLTPGQGYDLYVMNADGTDQHPLVTGPGDQVAPAWSPDGTRIAYAQGNFLGGGQVASSIWSVAADGSDPRQLTTAAGVNNDPVWSPDGKKIAFESNRGEDYDVYAMNADGTAQANLTNHPALDASPAWSPDGKKIAFVSDRSRKDHREIYVMNANGGHVVRVTQTPLLLWNTQPDWQPIR